VPTGEESNGVLSVSEISVSFGGITALDGVSLDVSQGEVLGVIGPNGAGKTTLFNVICGFVRPGSGTLSWRGKSLAGIRPHRLAGLGVARTLQGVGLFTGLTVLENVMVGAQRFRRTGLAGALLALPRSDRDERALRDRATAALQRLNCADMSDRLPETLPYAVQKRVALARALAGEPQLLLLDEPAGGLDSGELTALADTISSLGSSIAVMLVDHHMDLVTSVCDRLVVLDFGRVIASGDPDVVRQDPRVLEAYLGREAEAAGAGVATGSAGPEGPTGSGDSSASSDALR
jgi:branched-chain amino acid transport system ATP-binding protein